MAVFKRHNISIEESYTILSEYHDELKLNRSLPKIRYALAQALYQMRKYSPALIDNFILEGELNAKNQTSNITTREDV